MYLFIYTESQIQKKIAKIDAETISIIQKIENKMSLLAQNTSQQIQEIENEIVKLKATAYASAKKCNSLFT
jgi:hypothetical protein